MTGFGEVNMVLALSLLLTAGFALARLAKALRLPSVTGYILAGMTLGPSGLNLVGGDTHGDGLQVFTSIALMLVAFGIGERFDLQQLRASAKALAWVSSGEVAGSFVLTGVAVGLTAWLTGMGGEDGGTAMWVATALVAAAIAVATAPAATVAVIRECEASGPVTRLVLSSVVVNNALSVTLFGLAVAGARALLGTHEGPSMLGALAPMLNVVASLALGIVVGLVCDLVVHKLNSRADVLVASLAAVFFCGGLAAYLGMSALLAGMGAGFAVVNRDRRDVRAFRALNDFEPPLYGIFFALAGAQLSLAELASAGAIGVAFILARAMGKYFGAWLGARSANLPRELAGSVMLLRVGEVPEGEASGVTEQPRALDGIEVVPWTWPKLTQPDKSEGHVVMGLAHPATAAGITRIGALIGHHYRARPLALHVVTGHGETGFWSNEADRDAINLFRIADGEARSLGCNLDTEVEFTQEVSEGILRVAEEMNAHMIVVGHPLSRNARRFCQIVDGLARDAVCPVVVIRFAGALHTERILVPISGPEDLRIVQPLTCALGAIMEHHITLLRLMPPEMREDELAVASAEVMQWPRVRHIPSRVRCEAVAAESRTHTILQAAEDHDIIVMATSSQRGLRRAFFGSLAEDVALRSKRTMLLVHGGLEARTLEDIT
jgi:Kef-type K+ transport system membrane component KefB/nucleotide-binding universal stress UspA family protein